MPFKIEDEWLKDKAKLIGLGCILSVTAFPLFIFVVYFFVEKFQQLGELFFLPSFIYLLLYNYYMFKYILNKKGRYFIYETIFLIFSEIIALSILAIIIAWFKIRPPRYGAAWVGGFIVGIMLLISYIIYQTSFISVKRTLRRKDNAKGIVKLNKFQEKSKEKIEDMLKSLGIKYEEFKVVEGDEILLQSYMEIKDKTFMIEISEDAIALGAEEKEAAFILELIDYESSKKLINDFCERTKDIFEMVNQFGKYYKI